MMSIKESSSNNIVTRLPEEMLTEVLKHTATNSVTDFINTKLSCKPFLQASNYDYIFENLSMDKHLNSLIPWQKHEKVLLKICKRARNAEALHRGGMINFFSGRKVNSGLNYLKKAAEKGHIEAIYAYGIILICFGERKQGLEIVSSLNVTTSSNKSSLIKRIVSCRSKAKELLKSMWISVSLAAPKVTHCKCSLNHDQQIVTKSNCLSSKDKDWEEEAGNKLVNNLMISCCDSFFWKREAAYFCSMLRK